MVSALPMVGAAQPNTRTGHGAASRQPPGSLRQSQVRLPRITGSASAGTLRTSSRNEAAFVVAAANTSLAFRLGDGDLTGGLLAQGISASPPLVRPQNVAARNTARPVRPTRPLLGPPPFTAGRAVDTTPTFGGMPLEGSDFSKAAPSRLSSAGSLAAPVEQDLIVEDVDVRTVHLPPPQMGGIKPSPQDNNQETEERPVLLGSGERSMRKLSSYAQLRRSLEPVSLLPASGPVSRLPPQKGWRSLISIALGGPDRNVGLIRMIYDEARRLHQSRPSFAARRFLGLVGKKSVTSRPATILREACADIMTSVKVCTKAYRLVQFMWVDAKQTKERIKERRAEIRAALRQRMPWIRAKVVALDVVMQLYRRHRRGPPVQARREDKEGSSAEDLWRFLRQSLEEAVDMGEDVKMQAQNTDVHTDSTPRSSRSSCSSGIAKADTSPARAPKPLPHDGPLPSDKKPKRRGSKNVIYPRSGDNATVNPRAARPGPAADSHLTGYPAN